MYAKRPNIMLLKTIKNHYISLTKDLAGYVVQNLGQPLFY